MNAWNAHSRGKFTTDTVPLLPTLMHDLDADTRRLTRPRLMPGVAHIKRLPLLLHSLHAPITPSTAAAPSASRSPGSGTRG